MPPKPAVHADPIGRRIKEIRAFLGRPRRPWSQGELAKVLGMDVRTLRRREADGELSGETAATLAALARCDVSWVLTGEGRRPGEVKPLLADPGRGVTESSSTQPPEALMALYVDAIVGAVRDILEHDHELELTPRGRAFLGDVFLELGAKLHARGHVDASRLFDVALTLKEGERKKKRGP